MPMTIGMEIGFGAFTPSGTSYETEATALFARFSTDPGSTRKNAINTCIASLKSAGVWTKLDALWVFAAHEAASAVLNWVSASHNMALTGAPTFTTDQGYTTTGGTAYLATSDNLSTYTQYQQNSAHMAVWLRSSAKVNGRVMGQDAFSGVNLIPYFTDNNFYVRINDNPETGAIAAGASSAGLTLGNRSGATSREAYYNGTSLGTYGSAASQAVGADVVNIGRENSTCQVSAASVGASLNSTEQLALYNALNTLKTAVGW